MKDKEHHIGLGLLLALLCLPITLRGQSQQQMLRDSLVAATRLMEFHPDSVDLRLRKARWNIELGQWDTAKNEYDYIIKQHPDNVAALFFRSYVHDKLDMPAFARNDLERILRIVPGHYEATLGLVHLYQREHKLGEALDIANRLVAQHPDSADAWAIRAGVELERSLPDVALYDYDQAIRLSPTNQSYRLSRLDVLVALKKVDELAKSLLELEKLGVPRSMLMSYYQRMRRWK